jgi:beclin 1
LGLVAFLGCIKELGDYAVKKDSRFELPYKINKDQIGEDGNIKMQGTSNQVWTKALKYMLVDLKWLIAFCCS